jgi:hypothetical protein
MQADAEERKFGYASSDMVEWSAVRWVDGDIGGVKAEVSHDVARMAMATWAFILLMMLR